MKKRGWGGALDSSRGDQETRLEDGARLRQILAAGEEQGGDKVCLLYVGGNHYNLLLARESASHRPRPGGPESSQSGKRPGEAVVGIEPKEMRRRRIRGKRQS